MLPPIPPHLNLALKPTPLQALDRLSQQLGGPRIWVKRDDMTGSVLSGNKVRKLDFLVAAALEQGADTLITCGGLQSNHCRATALVAAQLGLRSHLLLRLDSKPLADGNYFLDQLVGAEISLYEREQYSRELPKLLAEHEENCHASGHKAFVIPTGGSNGIGIWGYIVAALELLDDFERHGISPTHVICATGSGGTQAGLTLGLFSQGTNIQVLGMAVCDNTSYFINKVTEDILAWNRLYNAQIHWDSQYIHVNDQYIGPGYAKADKEVFDTIEMVASLEGLILDPVYSGKAFHGMLREIERGRFAGSQDIVFMHTGGIFGTFSQRQQFSFAH